MTETSVIKADIAIIGAGSGGLSVAAGAAQMGTKVVLVEKGEMGGDCLNTGCVPSKALIAAAEAAETVRTSGKFGVNGHEPAVDFLKVHDHVHGVIAGIAPHDSVERFEDLGVQVIKAAARFVGSREIEAGGQRIRARRFVVATGSSPFVPPIPGIDKVPYLTNETIFSLTDAPDHLIVVGGGPIGIEMAQAHRRLGVKVTVIEGSTIMGKDDPDAVEVVRQRLIEGGVELLENAKVESVVPEGNRVSVLVSRDGPHRADRGLASPARGRPARQCRSSRPRCGRDHPLAPRHRSGRPPAQQQQAGVRDRRRRRRLSVHPHGRLPCRYRHPECAVQPAGQGRLQGRALGHLHRSRGRPGRPDRGRRPGSGTARPCGSRAGPSPRTTGPRRSAPPRASSRSSPASAAGSWASPWSAATPASCCSPGSWQCTQGLKIGAMAGIIAPYPTLGEASKRAAGAYYAPKLFSDRTKTVVGLMQRLP